MHRSQLCADPNRRRTNPLGQTACMVLRLLCIDFGTRSLRPAQRQRLVISCVRRWPSSSRDCLSALNSRQAPQMLAFERVDRNCHPSGSRTSVSSNNRTWRSHAASRALVRAKTMSRSGWPRTGTGRASSAHSCDLCIGVVALNRWRGSRPSTAVGAFREVPLVLGLEND